MRAHNRPFSETVLENVFIYLFDYLFVYYFFMYYTFIYWGNTLFGLFTDLVIDWFRGLPTKMVYLKIVEINDPGLKPSIYLT